MYNEEFISRLTQLRLKHGVSARDMSLTLGQNPGYINNIESGKAMPSMSVFFYICEYFQISPKEFFDLDASEPQELSELIVNLKLLNKEQLHSISTIVKGLTS